MLDDLVLGGASTAANDIRHAGRRAALDAERVFAHVVPPHVFDRAATFLAMDTLTLRLADNDVLQDGTGLNDEDRTFLVTFILPRALHVGTFVFMPPSNGFPGFTTYGLSYLTFPLLVGQVPVGIGAADEVAMVAAAMTAADATKEYNMLRLEVAELGCFGVA
uniref:Uncharacterized protein n=1 Tax=Globisporangium ultimum (strain ATCC 200006 / CBS 805.95 / DAOM BR144) TaxID=431595 RepID=K3X5E4_GLOUD